MDSAVGTNVDGGIFLCQHQLYRVSLQEEVRPWLAAANWHVPHASTELHLIFMANSETELLERVSEVSHLGHLNLFAFAFRELSYYVTQPVEKNLKEKLEKKFAFIFCDTFSSLIHSPSYYSKQNSAHICDIISPHFACFHIKLQYFCRCLCSKLNSLSLAI